MILYLAGLCKDSCFSLTIPHFYGINNVKECIGDRIFMMKFIHTADFHLDAKMEATMTPEQAAERRQELLKTFEDIALAGHTIGASAILICGDFFDSITPSPSAISHVCATIERYKDLDFILLCGNHDETVKHILPEMPNLKTFPQNQEAGVFRYGNVDIWGSENPGIAPSAIPFDANHINIVMLHGERREASSPDGISLPLWQNHHVDYMALGHYHSYEAKQIDGRGVSVYAGCPAGRGFDECGKKGYVLLTISDGKLSHEFVELKGRVLHRIEVSVATCASLLDIEQAILDATKEIEKQDALRIELHGAPMADIKIMPSVLEKRLSDRFWFVRIKDHTSAIKSTDDYLYDTSLAGVFVRAVYAKETNPERRERIIKCGLAALRGEEIAE